MTLIVATTDLPFDEPHWQKFMAVASPGLAEAATFAVEALLRAAITPSNVSRSCFI